MMSKVVVFCNKSTKVEMLGEFLQGKGIPNVALTSNSDIRKRGSNQHLDGFLKYSKAKRVTSLDEEPSPSQALSKEEPRVLITTSLLSRGLDFSPAIRHVFIVDEPRNVVDFLHRAGRTGRAGMPGKVVIFGKKKGRGRSRLGNKPSRVHLLLSLKALRSGISRSFWIGPSRRSRQGDSRFRCEERKSGTFASLDSNDRL